MEFKMPNYYTKIGGIKEIGKAVLIYSITFIFMNNNNHFLTFNFGYYTDFTLEISHLNMD